MKDFNASEVKTTSKTKEIKKEKNSQKDTTVHNRMVSKLTIGKLGPTEDEIRQFLQQIRQKFLQNEKELSSIKERQRKLTGQKVDEFSQLTQNLYELHQYTIQTLKEVDAFLKNHIVLPSYLRQFNGIISSIHEFQLTIDILRTELQSIANSPAPRFILHFY